MAESRSRWELRKIIAMAICGTSDVDLYLRRHPRTCACKRDMRPVTDVNPTCAAALEKADAVLRLLDVLDQQQRLMTHPSDPCER